MLALLMLMTERGDEREIVALLASSVPSIARCRLVGIHEGESGWQPCGPAPLGVPDPAEQIAGLDSSGGPIDPGPTAWAYALPLRSFGGIFGYAVVAADEEPSSTDQLLLRLLAQQTGIALANARLHERERTATSELRSTNMALAETLGALELSTAIHARLTDVAAAGGDQSAIAQAVHDLTSYPVTIEDRHGNLRAWAGPNPPPDPYPKDLPRVRSAMLRRAMKAGTPIREGDHLLVIASPQDDLLGVLALVDPSGTAGERQWTALEHGATVLAMELARLRAVAETELRLGRDLVDELLSSADEERTLARAQGLGYDLLRSHRVVVVTIEDDRETEGFFHAVRRAALDLGVGSLLVARANSVVVISDADGDWDRMRQEVDRALGGGRCRIGVGGRCSRLRDFPRSYREARLALKVQSAAGRETQSTEFDALGVIRILAESEELSGIERFVDLWLGALREYDDAHGAPLVETLSQYLEQGGNYEATAHALSTHRNTVKYRLQRIRAISGLDLADPDTRFNLQLATRALQTMNALGS
ncbi:MAG: sugar diacid utilization regulator [Actinomycetia bacterium]|jgi:DNA-binding PucR family transcriptional regulator|nr:sugar diacid utilization regulator [Actinomycetes bacterium]